MEHALQFLGLIVWFFFLFVISIITIIIVIMTIQPRRLKVESYVASCEGGSMALRAPCQPEDWRAACRAGANGRPPQGPPL